MTNSKVVLITVLLSLSVGWLTGHHYGRKEGIQLIRSIRD